MTRYTDTARLAVTDTGLAHALASVIVRNVGTDRASTVADMVVGEVQTLIRNPPESPPADYAQEPRAVNDDDDREYGAPIVIAMGGVILTVFFLVIWLFERFVIGGM